MVDHNVLKEEISSSKRYRKLLDLKLTISGLRKKLPISISTELEGRIIEKIRTFDYPICSVATIKVIFTNGLSKALEPDECHYAMARGMKLSDYIFSHYASARDFQIESSELVGIRSGFMADEESAAESKENNEFSPLNPYALTERLNFILKKVDSLERLEAIYAENIPKMARDVNDLKDKVDKIYKKVSKSDQV